MTEPTQDHAAEAVFAGGWRPNRASTNVRLLSHYVSPRAMLVRGFEFVMLVAALLGAQSLRLEELKEFAWLHAIVYALACVGALQALELYSNRRTRFIDLSIRLLLAYGGAVVSLTLLYYVWPLLFNGRGVMGIAIGSSILGSLVLRLGIYSIGPLAVAPNRVLVVGEGNLANEVTRIARKDGEGLEYAGAYDPSVRTLAGASDVSYANVSLRQAAERVGASEIVVALRDERGAGALMKELLHCKVMGAAVLDAVSFIEREERLLRIDVMRPSYLVFNDGFGHGHFEDFRKRLLDVMMASMMLVLTSPVFVLAAIAIVLESGGPLFYSQERVGLGGRIFRVWKFRSMRPDAETAGKPQWAAKNDSRVTRVGRLIRMTRIDELPQLFNVLRGEMSFVGPRPERPFFVEQLRAQLPHYDLRHFAKPGLTGWSQVKYPYGASIEDALAKLRYDLYYVKNRSMLLDIVVICATVHTILFAKGAR